MPVFELPSHPAFPPPEMARKDGLLAVGGDLSPERIMRAYARGIFPWYNEDAPILWWSPDPRLVLFPSELHISKSLKKVMKQSRFQFTLDTAFEDVIRACAHQPRPGQDGTWLVDEMIEAYFDLHQLGLAHSVEAWQDGQLAGGLYGVSLGGVFFGESMFHHIPDASKAAFVCLVQTLQQWDFDLIDCQMTTDHLLRFGAREVARSEFLQHLERSLTKPTRQGTWTA